MLPRYVLDKAHFRSQASVQMATESKKSKIIELNVGGRVYATTVATLLHEPSSMLAQFFGPPSDTTLAAPTPGASGLRSRSPTPSVGSPKHGAPARPYDQVVIQKKSEDSYFIDRDGELFRYILDYLRNSKITLPDNFTELQRLREEAKFFKLSELLKQLKLVTPSPMHSRRGTLPALVNGAPSSYVHSRANAAVLGAAAARVATSGNPENTPWGYITVGYRGTFAFGRDGQADVKFRKLSRILVCGRAALCREVFGDSLNESRDPDRGGENRYTARLYLKHSSLELAFDTLGEHGFALITSCASGTCASGDLMRGSTADCEEQKWNHYNEFVFYRPRPSFVSTD